MKTRFKLWSLLTVMILVSLVVMPVVVAVLPTVAVKANSSLPLCWMWPVWETNPLTIRPIVAWRRPKRNWVLTPKCMKPPNPLIMNQVWPKLHLKGAISRLLLVFCKPML